MESAAGGVGSRFGNVIECCRSGLLLLLFGLTVTVAMAGDDALALGESSSDKPQSGEMPRADSRLGKLPLDTGTRRCLACHDQLHSEAMAMLRQSKHATLADPQTPLAGSGCASCHGASAAHLAAPARAAADVVFTSRLPGHTAVRNAPCLGCHQGQARLHWQGSRHERGNVACHDCHRIHGNGDPVLSRDSETQVCFGCHQQQRADTLKPYSHPIRQHEMTCSDCHNPHGSFNAASLHGSTPTETCFRCHAEKRGPFLWEHPPAREDCGLCHQAHGSVHVGMLKQRGPWLCQQCHLAQYHPSTAYSGTGLPPTGATSLLGKNCLNCHAQVHGSNHPSGIRQTR